MPVVLFDIDGTLVRTGGAGKAAMEAALRHAFALTELVDSVPYAGRTDPAIGRDLLEAHGVPANAANLRTLHEAYLAELPRCLDQFGGEVCPGIPELLPMLAAVPGLTLGLLTGNMRRGAERKLGHFGLWNYFAGGGFGDTHTDRDDVARDALRFAETHRGRPAELDKLWVIGDTPLDVSCARAIGAKAVAVATGWHSLDELKATGADHAVPTLDPGEVLAWVLGR